MGATRGKTNDFKSKFACISEASESTRTRMEESLPNYHEDHIAGKGDNSLQHYNSVHKFFLCLKQWRYPQQRQQWIKGGRNLKRFRRGTWRKSETKRRWSMKQGLKSISSFRIANGHLSFGEWRFGGEAPKIQRSSCTSKRYCERWFWILCSIHRPRVISITKWRQQKVMDIISRLPGCAWTSSWRSICLFPR